jgi:hypothetical protein
VKDGRSVSQRARPYSGCSYGWLAQVVCALVA